MAPQVGMPNEHIEEDLLEEYALGRLEDEAVIDKIEEHLLICEVCRNQRIQAEAYAIDVRAALIRFEAERWKKRNDDGNSQD
jgi:hypothetical protein